MRATLFFVYVLLISGCSVLKSPSAWNAEPLVIDEGQVHYEAIISAGSNLKSIEKLTIQGNKLLKKIQSLISVARKNLDRTSGGNYGVGLVAAAVGLSGLHGDALLGSGYLAGTHVALSNRLHPAGYMQQLQRSSGAFLCLNSLSLRYKNSAEKFSNAMNSAGFVASANASESAKAKASASASASLSRLGYSANINSYLKVDLEKFKQSYLRALDLSQEKLDSQISMTLPSDIQSQLIHKSKEAARKEGVIDNLPVDDPIRNFLIEHEKLDSDLLACIGLI